MTDNPEKPKRLHFPSMDDLGGSEDDSSDFFYQNDSGEYELYKPPSWAEDEWGDLDDDEAEGGETGGDQSSDSILAGEKEAYEKAMELTAGEDDFQYFPGDGAEENNRKFAMQHLQEEWGANTNRNVGVARFFLKNFLNENSIREAHVTGIGSHPLMILAFYKAARTMERLATGNGGETKTLKFKGMKKVMLKKMEERAKDLAARTYADAKNKIIEMHGGISYGG